MSATEDYLNSREKFESISKELHLFADLIWKVAKALETHPDRLVFANSDKTIQMDESFSLNSIFVNAHEWKSVGQIVELLEQYHEAKNNMVSLWDAVPLNYRKELPLPNSGHNFHSGEMGRKW